MSIDHNSVLNKLIRSLNNFLNLSETFYIAEIDKSHGAYEVSYSRIEFTNTFM